MREQQCNTRQPASQSDASQGRLRQRTNGKFLSF